MLKTHVFILRLCRKSLRGREFYRKSRSERNEWGVVFFPQKASRQFGPARSTIFLYLSHHSPLDDAFFISRYIPFNPRVVQRIIRQEILLLHSFLFHALLNVNTDLRILNCRRFARKSINKNHVLTTFMLKKRGFILFLSR